MFSIWMYFKNVIYSCGWSWIVSIDVKWSFRNHSNMLICCSRNIYYYYQCWKQLCHIIFFWKLWLEFLFFWWTEINGFTVAFVHCNAFLLNDNIYFPMLDFLTWHLQCTQYTQDSFRLFNSAPTSHDQTVIKCSHFSCFHGRGHFKVFMIKQTVMNWFANLMIVLPSHCMFI